MNALLELPFDLGGWAGLCGLLKHCCSETPLRSTVECNSKETSLCLAGSEFAQFSFSAGQADHQELIITIFSLSCQIRMARPADYDHGGSNSSRVKNLVERCNTHVM